MLSKFLLSALAAGLIAASAQAVTVPDYSFETPVQSGGNAAFTYNPTVAGVTFNAGSGIQRNGSAWVFANAPDGQQTGFIQSNNNAIGAIAFALSDLVIGQTYQVVFAAAARPTYAINPITVALNSSQIGSYSVTSTAWADYITSTFTAAATTATLSFTGSPTTNNDNDVGLDNVRVAAVPEPATWGMMILGFGAIGMAMRRRRKGFVLG